MRLGFLHAALALSLLAAVIGFGGWYVGETLARPADALASGHCAADTTAAVGHETTPTPQPPAPMGAGREAGVLPNQLAVPPEYIGLFPNEMATPAAAVE
jgi:hypothetical protein